MDWKWEIFDFQYAGANIFLKETENKLFWANNWFIPLHLLHLHFFTGAFFTVWQSLEGGDESQLTVIQ